MHAQSRQPEYNFQTQSSEDLSQSPARRIPVEEAVARGQISPQRGAALLSGAADPGPSSKTPVFHIPPQDTPARRVQLAPPTPGQGKWQGIRFGSPTRSKSPELNEPRPPWNASTAGGAGPSGSKSRSSPRTVVSPLKKGKLPFPLIPSVSDQPVPSSTSSTSDATSSERTTPSIIKISRSNLKQPTSRIPRIGQKPYSRPPANVGTTKPSRLPLKSAETVKAAPQVTQGMRVAGGASSDSVEAGPSNLKRKRPPSPQSKPRPVALRQVPLLKGPPKITPAPARAASPAKRGPVTKFRMVDLHSRPEGIEPSQDGLELDGNPISSPIKRAPVGRFRMVDLHARPVDSFHRDKSPELGDGTHS
ncbi:hypothetical protein C8F01DRAFT_69390 [Mycena amicta]|nr:hypothetical protein C8F01DRAFT_69390 [Mycena amicta]